MRIHGRLIVAASALLVAAPACTGTFRTSVQSGGSEAHGSSFTPALEHTGRVVAFASDASDLVPNDGNGASDVFVRNTVDQTTTLVSRSSGDALGNGNSGNPSVSADGRYVLFTSLATNFVAGDDNAVSDVFLRDRQLGTTALLSHTTDGTVANGTSVGIELSDDGRKALIRSNASDLVAGSSGEQLYLVNLAAGTITRVSQPSLCPLHHDLSLIHI